MKKLAAILAAFAASALMGAGAFAQSGYVVKGVIEDPMGPVIGATVLEQGTSNGTMTDFDGNYSLIASSADAVIEISCIGYATQTFKASEVPATIMLREDAEFLDEVVVIGYGSQKKKEVTGSVASIKSEDFNAGVKTNPMGLLQGKVAGLNIIKTTSDPTSTGYNIQIRGFSTLDKGTGTAPLFIVDGVPVSSIDNISSDEIASMDVLKDGSAAAIYGTRGTNGVIIITTKRGDAFSDVATTRVEYSGYASVSVRNAKTGMATAEQFRNLETLSGGKAVSNIYTGPDGESYNTDWLSEVCRPAAIAHNHNVAIIGSASNFNYRASLNYKNAEGIARTTNRNEIVAKLTAGQKALDGWLDMQYDMSYMRYRNDYFCGDFKNAALLNPTYPVYDETSPNGYFWRSDETGFVNPVENMNQKESYGVGNFFRGSVKATVNIKPVKGLKVSGFAAIEEGDNAGFWYNSVVNTDASGSGKSGRSHNTTYNKLFELTADYVRTFEGGHNLAFVAGVSRQDFYYDIDEMANKGYAVPDVMKYYKMGNGDASKKYMSISSDRNSHVLIAQFARANYNYREKYLLSASLRREGSSRFGANHKWGWFPAVSAGWRVSGEDFMKDIRWVDDLKVRAGFGVTGNDLASDLRSVELLSNGGTFWYDGAYVYTYTVSQNVNPDLRWEKKYEYNLGFDYSLFKDRVYGSLDVYYRHTKDLLWDYEVPTPPYQYSTLLANAGKMDSYGVELSVSVVPVKNDRITWTTTPVISFNRNKITSLSDPSMGFNYTETTSGGVGENGIMNTDTQILVEGQAVGTFYGYKFFGISPAGIWTYTMPDHGDGITRYCDESTAVEGDRQPLGNAQPLFTFGWNNSIHIGNWDATMFLRGVVGNKILNVTRWAYGPMSANNKNVFMKDVDGASTVLPQKAQFTDFYLEDGSYLKLDNLTIGYTFPLKDNKYVQSLRVYLTGQNLFTLTSYSGQDPEVNTTSVWNGGIDYPSFYPPVATFLVGLNLGLF